MSDMGPIAKLLPITAAAWLATAAAPFAAEPRLGLPVDCDMAKRCYIQNYFDHDAGPGMRDHTCGQLVYDGHNGIDFAVTSRADMRRGAGVVAAAGGVVVATRDGMDDVHMKHADPASLRDAALGNVVVIDHGDGWRTYYGHLQKGSIAVQRGQRVLSGQALGRIGLSGRTEFPHVHFEVRKDGKPIDPFVGPDPQPGCPVRGPSLWNEATLRQLAYRETGILGFGVAERRPDQDAVDDGQHDEPKLSRNAEAVVLWARIFGVGAKDQRIFRLTDPTGQVILQTRRPEPGTHKAQMFEFVGKQRGGEPFVAGRYQAEFAIVRPGPGGERVVLAVRREIEVR